MIPADLYLLRGDGGRLTSMGIDEMARTVREWNLPNVRVQVFDWRQFRQVIADINGHSAFDRFRQIVGYSIGGNAATWILGGLNHGDIKFSGINCQVDYAVFIDPTWLSYLTPLTSKTLKHAHHYRNTSLDIVGHVKLELAPDYDQHNLVEIETYTSHLILDFDPAIQRDVCNNFHDAVLNGREPV